MKYRLKRITSIIICLILVLGIFRFPVYADDVVEFYPYDETIPYAVFDMYAEVMDSAAQSQEILNFVNQIRKEACDQGIYFSWTNKYLSPADYKPLTWNGAIERYALTRAVDINFNFSHGYNAVCGMPAGGSQDFYSENICWMGYRISPIELVKIYYKEKGVYLDAYNRGVAAGLSGASLTAFINSNSAGATGHYMSLINPGFQSMGSATIFRNATRNVLLLSYSPGDGSFYNLSGTQCLRIPVYAGRLGSCFGYNYPKEIECSSSASGGFYLFGNTGSDRFVRSSGISLAADNPDIVSADADMKVFTAHRGGTAGFRFMAGGELIGTPFSVRVLVPVESVSLASAPSSLKYSQETGYSLEGAAINVKYTDGRSEVLPVTAAMVASEARSGSKYNVTVAYMGIPVTISYDDETPDHPVGISVQAPELDLYYVGDTLDLYGGKAFIQNYSGSVTEYKLTDPAVTVSGFDSSFAGQKQVFVSADGFTGSFFVNVVNPPYLAWTELQPPVKTEYTEGEDLDLRGCVLTSVYSDGSRTMQQVDPSMISGFNKYVTGAQTVFVSSNGSINSFVVFVKEASDQQSGGGAVPSSPGQLPVQATASGLLGSAPSYANTHRPLSVRMSSVTRVAGDWHVLRFCRMVQIKGLCSILMQQDH